MTRALISALLSLCAACNLGEHADDHELRRLERLSFIPAARVEITVYEGPAPAIATSVPLLVDRFEITRGEWLEFQATLPGPVDPEVRAFQAGWTAETMSWPASFLALDEARACAQARGMRLLRAGEWMRVAMGSTPQQWPWGIKGLSLANSLELDLRRPAPVGTFESGRSPLGVYDMTGNVWEWVEEPLHSTPASASELTTLAWAMGGSFHTRLEPLYGFDGARRLVLNRIDLDPRTRADDVGLRCCAEAESYLLSHAAAFGASPEARRRIVAVGKSWGRDGLGLLERMAARADVPQQITWLLEGARS